MPSNRVLEPADEQMRPGTTWRSSEDNRGPINDLMRFVNYWLTPRTVVSQIPPPLGVGMTSMRISWRERPCHSTDVSALFLAACICVSVPPSRRVLILSFRRQGGGICDSTAAAPGSGRALHFHARPFLQQRQRGRVIQIFVSIFGSHLVDVLHSFQRRQLHTCFFGGIEREVNVL